MAMDYPHIKVTGSGPDMSAVVYLQTQLDGVSVDDQALAAAVEGVLADTPGIVSTTAVKSAQTVTDTPLS